MADNEEEENELLRRFSSLSDDDRIKKIILFSNTGDSTHFKLIEYAILFDPNLDVNFSALKRIHLFKEHPGTVPLLNKLAESGRGKQMEPYFSIALSRIGLISKEQLETTLNPVFPRKRPKYVAVLVFISILAIGSWFLCDKIQESFIDSTKFAENKDTSLLKHLGIDSITNLRTNTDTLNKNMFGNMELQRIGIFNDFDMVFFENGKNRLLLVGGQKVISDLLNMNKSQWIEANLIGASRDLLISTDTIKHCSDLRGESCKYYIFKEGKLIKIIPL